MIGTSSYSMVKSFIFIFLQQFLSIEHTQIFIMANMWILFVEPVIHSAGHHSRNWWTSFEICRDNTSRHLDQQQEIAPRRNCRPYSHCFPVPLLKHTSLQVEESGIIFHKRFTFLAGKQLVTTDLPLKRLVLLAPHNSQLPDNERKKKKRLKKPKGGQLA